MKPVSARYPAAVAYVAPFAAYVGFMALEHAFSWPVEVGYPIRLALTILVLLIFSRGEIRLRPARAAASIAIGLAVFVIWIAPDALFGYRHFWLFENSIMGKTGATLSPGLQQKIWFLCVRSLGSALLVPIIEEMFWRGWLMRWLIDHDFKKVPLGTYVPSAFWITAALFASEHGPYWEVGLAAGAIYNWWLVRTRSLADCILAHAVTNGVLAIYVLNTGAWSYWL